MRTRRSWRNQNRLWKMLCHEVGETVLASHPNGYSCRSLAERIVSGDKARINNQADYIVRCAGTVNFTALEAL